MTSSSRTSWLKTVIAIVGLAFVAAGLWLTALSKPSNFSMSVADDRNIMRFWFSGIALTLTGVGIFCAAVRNTTKSMPMKFRTKANIGAGAGFVLQIAAFFLLDATSMAALFGLFLFGASFPLFLWGAVNYSQGKGISKWFGLLGVGGILGLAVLAIMPDQRSEPLSATDK